MIKLKEELSFGIHGQQPMYVSKHLYLSEYRIRKLYINSMLFDAGWTEGSRQKEAL